MAAAQDDRLYRGFGSAPARRTMITASARGAANIARARGAPVSHQGRSPGWIEAAGFVAGLACGEADRASDPIVLLTQQEHIRLTVDGTIGDGSRVSPRQRGLP